MDRIVSPQQGRILIADDDAAIVTVLERILARAGFPDVASTTNSGAVVDMFVELGPDLLILDLTMPEPDGLAIMAQLGEIVPAGSYVPILVLTGDQSTEVKQRALAGGAKDFLTKPFDVPEVLLRIQNLLETRFLHLQARRHNRILEARVQQRTRKLEEARLDVLARLARAAEFRDDETGEHTRRVGDLSAAIARQLRMSSEEVEDIRLTAPLHDVGKIGIPDAILLKPSGLTAAERAIMETHTTIGAMLLSDSPWHLLKTAKDIALFHHEWWNGNGYPHGIAGEDIPWPARIVAVADVFDALSHERAYRRAWSRDEALAEIHAGNGTHFDPSVVEALLTVCAVGADPRSRRESDMTEPLDSVAPFGRDVHPDTVFRSDG